MCSAQGTPDFQFLSDDERLLGSDDLQLAEPAACSAFDGNEVDNLAEVNAQPGTKQLRDFLLAVVDRPTIEIGRFLVVVVEHLAQYLSVGRVAERFG